jgi:hypothetical protein
MTIQQYIILLINENINVSKINITNYFNFNQNTFDIVLNNNQQINMIVDRYQCQDQEIVEFYDKDNVLVAKAKGFNSVL